ncbi:hypothetical protein LCGC14_1138490 [marine sediment metagenome]|uniref:Uncharacterized protein n=1 Tax=marine sediment metagenome TaxID=412755 RepID=A0A0F9M3U3_9ZZZZ
MSSLYSSAAALLGKGKNEEIEREPLDERAKSYIEQRWNELRNAYIIYHQSIWETLLFYVNQSWIEWSADRKVYQPQIPSDEFTPTPRINRFSPAIDAIASNFVMPEVDVLATKDELMAQGIATICRKLARHAIKENGLRSDYTGQEDRAGLAAQLFVLTGCFFTNVYPEKISLGQKPKQELQAALGIQCLTCDTYHTVPEGQAPAVCPECGGELGVSRTETPQPVIDQETGQPAMEEVHRWKVRCEIGNSLYAFPRPGATGMGKTPYFLWVERMHLDEITRRHKDTFPEGFEPQADNEFPDGYAVTYEHALNYYYTGYSSSTLQAKDSALVKHIYIEKGKVDKFPDGLHAVMVNHVIIFHEEWDFVEHPYTKADYLAIPTLFFARSVAFDVVEIQREINAYESLIKLHGMTSAVSPWVVEKDSLVSEITGRADKLVLWRQIVPGTAPPHREPAGRLDDGIYRKLVTLHEEIENITAAVMVFRGKQPGSITAGKAIDSLRAQAELMFARPVANWNNAWKETVRKIVKFYQRYLRASEIEEIVGKGRETQIQAFLNADLDTMVEFVATAQGLPRTRQEKRQELFDLYDRKALDLNDVNVKQKIFELFGETGLFAQFNEDATRARLEEQMMEQGKPPAFMPEIEDLQVHYSIHSQRIKSIEFESLPRERQR